MKIAIISLTSDGTRLSAEISNGFEKKHSCDRFSFSKYCDEGLVAFSDLKLLTSQLFNKYDALVFVCACGIAVRMIAPHIVSKLSDPAVIVVDEQGKFAVSLLSGHIGGANHLAEQIAKVIGAVPVITTATDAGGRFSPDLFAMANGLHICDIDAAKSVAAAVVNGEKIGFHMDCSEYKYLNLPDRYFTQTKAKVGICIARNMRQNPFEITLHLIPKNIIVGVGCKKDTPPKTFEDFILNMLESHDIPLFRVSELHTINIKEHELAINQFCCKYDIPIKLYSSRELMSVSGNFSHSDFVMETTGADNICERSAAIDGDRLIIKKTSLNGITFAAAEKDVCVDFERSIV